MRELVAMEMVNPGEAPITLTAPEGVEGSSRRKRELDQLRVLKICPYKEVATVLWFASFAFQTNCSRN